MAVDTVDNPPAIASEAARHILREPGIHSAVDGDAVVVVEADELAEFERSRERCRLVRYAFHETAVPGNRPGAMVHDLVFGLVELFRQALFRQRHADGVGQALAQWPGGCFDAGTLAELRMAGGFGMKLPESLMSSMERS